MKSTRMTRASLQGRDDLITLPENTHLRFEKAFQNLRVYRHCKLRPWLVVIRRESILA